MTQDTTSQRWIRFFGAIGVVGVPVLAWSGFSPTLYGQEPAPKGSNYGDTKDNGFMKRTPCQTT